MKMKNWICLLILLLTIKFNSEAASVRNKRNTAPDGVVLDSVNVLPGTSMLLSQEGKTVNITCKQSSSTATDVEFQLQVNSGPGGTWTPLTTASSAVWVFELEPGKMYKCVATNSAGRKESEIYQSDVISIKIDENPCKLHEFQPSLACTCKATSKTGNPNITVKWYADGFKKGSTVIYTNPDQGTNIPLKDGVINRNQMDFRYMLHATLTQCRLWEYNGIKLLEPPHNQILHQTEMDVTYFPDEILTNDIYTGKPDIKTQEEVVEYICRTESGRPDPTVIYQQKRRGSEQWKPIPDPPRKVPHKRGFNTTYKFNADFKLHNGTSFRCAVKENLTSPEPRQFNPIIVYYFAPDFKKDGENKTHAAYIVTVNSNLLTQQVTCDPPAVVQKLSNYQWNITIPILNSIITDYRGRCLADGINERVIDVAGYHNAVPTDEPVVEGWNGIKVFGVVFGIILILLILLILIVLWRLNDHVIEFLRWTSETMYEKDHKNWVKTRDRPQPETFRIIVDVYGTENDWELTSDKEKQEKAIKESAFQQLSRDQSVLDLVKEILRKYARINNLKTKLSNEIDKLLNEKRSIDGAAVVYNRDEDEENVSFMTQLNEEKRPLTNKEKQFIRDVGSAVDAKVDLFAKMSDAELCERGIFNIKPTVEIAENYVKETLNKEVKQQNGNLVTQIENQKVTDETKTEMRVADRNRSVTVKCESVLFESSLQKLEENKHSTKLDNSIYEISRDVLEIKLKIAVFKSIKELNTGRAENFQQELKEKLKQEENEERKNEEELNRIIHSSVCQAFKYITDMNEKKLKERGIVAYRIKDETAMSRIKPIIADRIEKEFTEKLKTVLEEKCQKARSSSSLKHWTYDISTAISVLSELAGKTLKTNTDYWKRVEECFGDEINSETNKTELREIVDECLDECIKTMENDSHGKSLEMESLMKEDWDVDQVQKNLKETYKRMIDDENYKEVWWREEVTNFNDFFTQEHVKIRAQKRNLKKNEESEEQSLILPDDFQKLFTYKESDVKPVCLVGEPGMGKTTQIVNQVLSWERSPFLKRFPMLFYIPLNELPADNACIYKYIYKHLLNREIRKVLPIDSFKEFVEENAEKSIFFLDGFDELKSDKAKIDIVHVTNELPEAYIVITTRESGGSTIVTDPKFTVVSISGFKQVEIIDILKRKFPERDPHLLFNKLRDAAPPIFKSNYYNPLILLMFCFLYMDEKEITIPSKLTDIYIDFTCFLISKRKEGLKLSKDCFFGDIENSKALKEICQVAYETLIKHQNSFTENKLCEWKMTALTCKEVSPRQKSDSSVQLRFIHKSVHEFLAAVHSVVQFNNSGEIPWNKCAFEQLQDELVKYGELYPRFMSGLLYRYKYNRDLGELFKTLIDEHLKAVIIVDKEPLVTVTREMALIPDYERFIELRSERTVLSEQLSICLNEADWPDDAISEIVPYMQKMLVVPADSRSRMNMLAKILEHKLCQIELVFMERDIELEPDEYRVLETAIASNTSLHGMILDTYESSIYDQYLSLCKKSNSINWCVWLYEFDCIDECYKKLNNEWVKSSHQIISEDDTQLISVDTNTYNTVESLIILTRFSAERLGYIIVNIHKSYPSIKHLYLRSWEDQLDRNTIRGLIKIIPSLKTLHLSDVIFDKNLIGSQELNDLNNALTASDIETIQLGVRGLLGLTTDECAAISDSVGSMPKLKRLGIKGSELPIHRVLDHLPRLTVLTIVLHSEADGDALVRYLSSDAVNQLREVSIDSRLDRPEQENRILKQLKHVSSIRCLKFGGSAWSNTQHDIDSFVKLIVELINNLPHLSDLYIDCWVTNRYITRDYIISELKKLNKRLRVEID